MTETDNLLYSVMTHNPQPLHLGVEAAKASEFGQILVNAPLPLRCLSVSDSTLWKRAANLGYDGWL